MSYAKTFFSGAGTERLARVLSRFLAEERSKSVTPYAL
jgi:hypothetical protein